MTKLYASFSPKNNVVLAEGLEPTCDQLPFLQGISLRGYARMVSTSAFYSNIMKLRSNILAYNTNPQTGTSPRQTYPIPSPSCSVGRSRPCPSR